MFFEDDALKISVDGSKAKYVYENNETVLKNVKIRYENKTESRITVPYITPSATLEGIDLSGKGEFSSMEDIQKRIFQRMGWHLKHKVLRLK